MDTQLLAQLDRRIEENHDHLCQRLDDLAEVIQATHATLSARLEAHAAYHQQNEHKWGVLKLAQKYPFRLAAVAFVSGWVLLASVSETSPWFQNAVGKILRLIFG